MQSLLIKLGFKVVSSFETNLLFINIICESKNGFKIVSIYECNICHFKSEKCRLWKFDEFVYIMFVSIVTIMFSGAMFQL